MTRLATFFCCDDLAAVAPGKSGYLGVYSNEMIVPALPTTLNQLFFVVRFRTPIHDQPKKMQVRIEWPGHEPFFQVQPVAPINPTKEGVFFQAQAVVRISPFEISKEGVIRVFVEDELTDNYAGGLRVRVGIPPELRLQQLAGGVMLAIGHYARLGSETEQVRERTAVRLIETLSDYLIRAQGSIVLPYPSADIRLVVDHQRLQVFFARPYNTDDLSLDIEPLPNGERVVIEELDRLGFRVKFDPQMPADPEFNYSVKPGSTESRSPDIVTERPPRKRRPKK
ncbi:MULTISPECIES: DUF6941 family protein [unclassified Bradyrhizobium]|uniref:DUF6941 family protein n=1 Tax=unclassified Bradyrhizobium TaxID=2631580 RepID=UPI002916F71C|nr:MULTISPECIES: hypothetical protein [unclassified Bradyrhizobium]